MKKIARPCEGGPHPVRLKLYGHSGPAPVSGWTIDFRLKTASPAFPEPPCTSFRERSLWGPPPNSKYVPVSSCEPMLSGGHSLAWQVWECAVLKTCAASIVGYTLLKPAFPVMHQIGSDADTLYSTCQMARPDNSPRLLPQSRELRNQTCGLCSSVLTSFMKCPDN